MGYFIGNNGYYEGVRVALSDREVSQRPTPDYYWNGEQWSRKGSREALHRAISNDGVDPEGTGIWIHAQTNARNAAASVYAALTGVGDEVALEQDLQGFLRQLTSELAAIGKPFSEEQLTAIDNFLSLAGFEWSVKNL